MIQTKKPMPTITTNLCAGEVARLAYLNWEKDGRQHGRDQYYWLEAETQLKATRQLLLNEYVTDKTATATSPAKPRTRKAKKI
jgi:hypothetical protein